jgi:hypothetical protein
LAEPPTRLELCASRVGDRVEVKVVHPGDVVGSSFASPLLYGRPLVTQISTYICSVASSVRLSAVGVYWAGLAKNASTS